MSERALHRHSERQFLVMRDAFGQFRSLLVFEDGDDRALQAYEAAERRGVDCCLLGADSLSTLCKTHPNWLDEPMPEFEDLLRETT